AWFLEDANASAVFKDNKMEIKPFAADFDNLNYMEGVLNSKRDYNLEARKIVHVQYFGHNDWLQRSNERLAACFDKRILWFAAPALDADFDAAIKLDIPISHLVYDLESRTLKDDVKKADFIEHQGEMINM